MAGHGETRHRVAVDGGRQPARRLVGRHARWDEEDPVEGEALPERLREDQVTDVDRVEGAAEDPETELRHASRYSRS